MMSAEESLKSFSWYHGTISRDEANKFLEGKRLGLFLIRKRKAKPEYVLSVSEIQKVCHYIISDVNGMYFKIGEQRFADIPSIIEFYKKHMLDTTTLTEPVLRPGTELDPTVVVNNLSNADHLMKVRAKFDFHGKDPEDLPFKKSDMLTVIRKEEEEWWLARDNTGREGMIPATYVEVIVSPVSPARSPTLGVKPMKKIRSNDYAKPKPGPNNVRDMQLQIPVDHVGPLYVVAILDKEANFYDEKVLGFKKGDKIEVLNRSDNGSWEGKNLSTGKTGLFPFNYVRATK